MGKRVAVVVLALTVLCRGALAADQWVEVASPHFTLMTNASEKDGRKTVDQLERMRWVFQTLFPQANVDPAVPIVIVAARDEKTFNGMEPAAYLAKGSLKLAGYFLHSTDKNYILLRLDASGGEQHPFASVYHEYTHLQFASAGEWMPLWMNEGTAEFFQNTQFNGKNVHLGQASVDDIFYLRDNALIPLNVLLAVDQKSPYYHEEQKGSVFYSESWALTHYLMITDRQKNLNRVGNYMNLVRNHEDPVKAGEEAFGNLKQLEKELDRYIRQAMYMEFVLNSAAAPIDESTYKVRPMTQLEADARRADVLAYLQRIDEAHALAEAVLKADATNAQANETLGFLAFRAGKQDEARKRFGEAAKLGSQDFLTYFYLAQFSMGESMSGGDDSVESSLRKAIELNPRFAPSYDRLASYYAMRHEKLDEAHLLGVQAVQYDPASIAYRVNTANVLMEMEKYDDAMKVLKAAAAVAGNAEDREMVQIRMDQLEQFQTKKAAFETAEARGNQGGKVDLVNVVDVAGPARPTVMTAGKGHGFEGVIRGVKCSNPYVIEFSVVGTAGKSVLLYNNNFTTIDLTAAPGVPTKDTMFPCSDFEGRNARAQYVESPDKTVDGQVTAVEMEK